MKKKKNKQTVELILWRPHEEYFSNALKNWKL